MTDITTQTESNETSVRPTAHLASLAHWSFTIALVVPFANLIIPLVLLMTKGKEDDFVRDNAKEALNLLIWMFILAVIFIILSFVLIGFLGLFALGVYVLVLPIVGAIQTMSSTEGTPAYRYPWIFRLVK